MVHIMTVARRAWSVPSCGLQLVCILQESLNSLLKEILSVSVIPDFLDCGEELFSVRNPKLSLVYWILGKLAAAEPPVSF